jgi:hypothetical protein
VSNSHDAPACAAVQGQLSLLLYGELSFDEEERVESHLDACEECRTALQRERALQDALGVIEIEPSPALLHECRENLRTKLTQEAGGLIHEAGRDSSVMGLSQRLTEMFARWRAGLFQGHWALRPAGALTLLAVGFVGGRMIPSAVFTDTGSRFQVAGISEPAWSRVRSVEPTANGRVQIVLDETRQRVLSGRPEDAGIRALLLSAAKDPSDPGVRAETMDVLTGWAQSPDVRDALIDVVEHDQNEGVRLKAMAGLKPFARQSNVRGALSQVLLSDHNPGLRTQAIDLLTSGPDADQDMVGTLQELMQRGEPQDYVRERCLRVLHSVRASAETY